MAVSGAQVKIHEDTTNKLYAHTTNQQGCCKLLCSTLAAGKLTLEHPDYFSRIIEYGLTRPLDLRHNRKNLLHLTARPFPGEIEFLLSTQADNVPTIYMLTPGGQVSALP